MPSTPPTNRVLPHFLRGSGPEVASASERVILDLVRRSDGLLRADLSRASGLSVPGAKGLIDGLVARGMLRLGAPQSRGRGQPTPAVRLVENFAYAIGLSVLVDGFWVAIVDFAGGVLEERFVSAYPLRLEKIVRDGRRHIQDMLARHRVLPERVFGMGVAMTGPFVQRGASVNPPLSMPDEWAATDLARYFSEHFGLPIWLDNDAKCAATAEALYGKGRETRDFVYLHFTDGFGAGLVQDGQLISGAHGNAGELGRLLALAGRERPTLESLRVGLVAAGHELPDIHAMLERYDPAWPEVSRWIEDVAPGLSLVVAALVAIADPAMIVFGARLPADVGRRLIASVQQEARPRRGISLPGPRLELSDLPEHVAVIGAATLPFKEHFFR
jgi:predicted NBD/HSP70 family sugar kinase